MEGLINKPELAKPDRTGNRKDNVNTDIAISGISVLRTGRAEQHREHRYGTWKPKIVWALTSRTWVDLPMQCFLIKHRDGPVLFDTGIDPAVVLDPDYISQAIGRVMLKRLFRLYLTEKDALRYQLEAEGVAPDSIKTTVISHLHFDHVGGIRDVPNSELLVCEREWAMLSEPHPERDWVLREHIEIPGANWQPFKFKPTEDPLLKRFGGAFDIRGDESMVIIPTPGHTPGSQSLLVRSEDKPPILLAGDLAYEPDLIAQDRVPGTGNKKQLRDTYAKIRALQADLPDLIILASHDPAASKLLQGVF